MDGGSMKRLMRQSMSLLRPRTLSEEMTSSRIRKYFLDYFCENKEHEHVRSSPVFSLFDPTLAFVNAGMNQFKDIFLGFKQSPWPRVSNCQKCIRVGGKHNDLIQVGMDGTHHSFFEMLGNWSFGDYFKREACLMSWDLLTKVYNLPSDRLYVTYFGGDETLGLRPDLETKEIWLEIGVPQNHIFAFGSKENFWEMCLSGPCGPCTEIHFDHIPGRKNAGSLVNSGSSDLTELWNIVFLQYNREENGKLAKLRTHFVDTGMGFERLVAILQGKTSNYDTDLFLPLFDTISKHSKRCGYAGDFSGSVIDRSYRILADHGRMITVALSDGMIPNHQNKVRTIIRRALFVSQKVFDSDASLLKEITNRVAETLSDAYPQVGCNLQKIHYIIGREEETLKSMQQNAVKNFKKMEKVFPSIDYSDLLETPQLVNGLVFIEKNILDKKLDTISSENAWKLFDSIGIHPPILEKLAFKLGLKFDVKSFEIYESQVKEEDKKKFNKQSQHSRHDSSKPHLTDILKNSTMKPTKDNFKYEYRIDERGKYIFPTQETTIQMIICGNQLLNDLTYEQAKGQLVGLILDRTQLFSKETNQESDEGTLLIKENILFHIQSVVKFREMVIHFGVFATFPRDATVSISDGGILKINEVRRLKLMRNHTALHLLNAAVRKKLFVTQEKRSFVSPDKLSFDLMIFHDKLKVRDVDDLETFVRKIIKHNVSVNRKPFPLSQFYTLEDVIFVPGEDVLFSEVPVIEVNCGYTVNREFCIGTHVLNTLDIQEFVVRKLQSVSYNVINIEAVTGEEAIAIRKMDVAYTNKLKVFEEKMKNIQNFAVSEVVQIQQDLQIFSEEVSRSESTSYLIRNKIMNESESYSKILNKLIKRNKMKGT